MSTLPGGPADKAGLVHEALWGVFGMVKVLTGEAKTIRIEEPRTDGAEFYLERGVHEHWQAKRQVLSQKTWSLHLLKSEEILRFFRQRVDAGESCVFASIADAPELRALAENARQAHDWAEFQSKFLKAEKWQKDFSELRKHLGYSSPEDVFKFLRRVRVEGARELTLEGLLLPIFQAWFTGPPQTVLSVLRDLYTKSVHQEFTASDIRRHLDSCGITDRALSLSVELRDSVRGITASYLAGQRSRFIRGENIPRQSAADIISRVLASDSSLDILITAPAGGGKSASLSQIVEGLAGAGVPVLALRLDRIEPVASTQALGHPRVASGHPLSVLRGSISRFGNRPARFRQRDLWKTPQLLRSRSGAGRGSSWPACLTSNSPRNGVSSVRLRE